MSRAAFIAVGVAAAAMAPFYLIGGLLSRIKRADPDDLPGRYVVTAPGAPRKAIQLTDDGLVVEEFDEAGAPRTSRAVGRWALPESNAERLPWNSCTYVHFTLSRTTKERLGYGYLVPDTLCAERERGQVTLGWRQCQSIGAVRTGRTGSAGAPACRNEHTIWYRKT